MRSLILTLLLLSSAASAEVPFRPVLSKITSGGNAPSVIATRKECWIFADRIVIRNESGGAALVREIPAKLSGAINAMVYAAAAGAIVKALNNDEDASDKPSTVWRAYLYGATEKKEIQLRGDGVEKYYNKAPEAHALAAVLEQNCN
jgi:hypothetical protein